MPDVSNLKVGSNNYSIKDATARTNASSAQSQASNALSIANTAKTTADNANSTANNALSIANETTDNLENTNLIATYESTNETLEYKLQKGVGG